MDFGFEYIWHLNCTITATSLKDETKEALGFFLGSAGFGERANASIEVAVSSGVFGGLLKLKSGCASTKHASQRVTLVPFLSFPLDKEEGERERVESVGRLGPMSRMSVLFTTIVAK